MPIPDLNKPPPHPVATADLDLLCGSDLRLWARQWRMLDADTALAVARGVLEQLRMAAAWGHPERETQ